MSNAFQYYQQLRKQQIHYTKIINPEVRVPKHQAYKPIKAKIQQARLKQRLKQEESIERQNAHIMKKLFTINMRKPKLKFSDSTPNFSLPPIVVKKKAFEIPEHEQENNIIAQKLINSKSSINVKSQLRDYNEKERIKKSLSKYHSLEGQFGSQVIDRKKYIAELMLLKKMKIAEQTESRLRQYITSNNANSRVQRVSSQKGYHSRK